MATETDAFVNDFNICCSITDDFRYLDDIIKKNEYVKKCTSNKAKDFNSLSYLIDRELSQSDCIKIGTGIEKVLRDVILDKNKSLSDIKQQNEKGKKEKDHLFCCENTKTVYYAELKSNLYLDTEKCKSTSQKCSDIVKELQVLYPEYTIEMYLVGLRYCTQNMMPKQVCKKYECIKDNVVGVDEYLQNLGACISFGNESNYKKFLNMLACEMFSISNSS
jgi:hypothetical protein